MKLRIISGEFGRRFLRIPSSMTSFRPTLERVREAVANSLGARIHGATVADVCAGSGAYGFEMLSRGAASVDFVEKHKGRVKHIRANAAALGVENRCSVISSDARRFVQFSSALFDIIFFDPPYNDEQLVELVPALRAMLEPNGVLVVEKRVPKAGNRHRGANATPNTRVYGTTAIEYITRADEE